MSNEMNLPWKLQPLGRGQAEVLDNFGRLILTMPLHLAAHIVKCVNNHNALVEALETVLANSPEPYCAITRAVDRQVREALAAARGEL